MKRLLNIKWFMNISIAKKLYFAIGLMLLLITIELFSLWFSVNTLSSVRAFVNGEGLWSKAQKDAIYTLRKYAHSGKEEDYQQFLDYLKIPLGDRKTRIELGKENPDPKVLRQGFLEGQNHPDDIDGMIKLFQRFHFISYINKAIQIWTEADLLLADLELSANKLHTVIMESGILSREQTEQYLDEIDVFNAKLTLLENEFSATLGHGSRWLENLILSILLIIALTVEISGLLLTLSVVNGISKGINEIVRASKLVSEGNFKVKSLIYSKDEIGQLAESFNNMTDELDSYSKALKASEQNFKMISNYTRSLIEASLDPLVTISAEGKITDVNEALVTVTGVPRGDLIGTDFSNYFTDSEKARNGYRRVFDNGFVSDYPLTIKHVSGKLTDVLYNASVYKDNQGKVLGVFAAARDITSQKQLAEIESAEREKELMRIEELERFRKLTVGRELKMMELKKEIEELKSRLNNT